MLFQLKRSFLRLQIENPLARWCRVAASIQTMSPADRRADGVLGLCVCPGLWREVSWLESDFGLKSCWQHREASCWLQTSICVSHLLRGAAQTCKDTDIPIQAHMQRHTHTHTQTHVRTSGQMLCLLQLKLFEGGAQRKGQYLLFFVLFKNKWN